MLRPTPEFRQHIVSLLILFLSGGIFPAFSQTEIKKDTSVKVINIINADVLKGGKLKGQSIQRLIGRVVMEHAGAFMYCDSAIFFDAKNSMLAFGRIHIQQGDSLSLYGDSLNYEGNTKVATMQGRVRLIDKQVNLNTNKLIYDRAKGMAYYNDNGETVTQKDNLTSKKGYYYVNKKEFAFRDQVVMKNPEYTLYTDTMVYNTVTDVSYFYGPTRIISEQSLIYCENGWYDKPNDKCQFNANAYVVSDNNILRGDSLYYERARGYGKGIGHVSIEDTVEKVTVLGNYAETFKNIQRYFVTDSAQMIQVSDGDTLYMHADTLVATKDTVGKRVMDGFHHVKFFKSDMQGACDSLSYTQRDSLLRMYINPVIWNDSNQITGDYIQVKISRGKIFRMDVEDRALMISQEDTIRFNQIGGDRMEAGFIDNQLRRIDVYNNGRTIYFPKEDDGTIIGLNKVESINITIYVENRDIQKIVFKTKPVGVLHPDDKVNPLEFRLDGFQWLIDKRPKNRRDIFVWP